MDRYDYIVIGGGLSGTSLIRTMSHSSVFQGKKVLMIEKKPERDDKHWCFWSDKPTWYSDLSIKRWEKLVVGIGDDTVVKNLPPYNYYCIHSNDYFDAFDRLTQELPFELTVIYEEYISHENMADHIIVHTTENTFEAERAFTSVLDHAMLQNKNTLWQVFFGMRVSSDQACFDDSTVRLMDFEQPRKDKPVSFFYTLPFNKNEALVEYTVFSTEPIVPDAAELLHQYIKKQYGCMEYSVISLENGIIPMTDHEFNRQDGRLCYIGTVGGQVKPSTGYAFANTHLDSERIIESLTVSSNPFHQQGIKRHRIYDKVMLSLMLHYPERFPDIIMSLFKKVPTTILFPFLSEASNLLHEFRIITAVPTFPMLSALIKTY